MKSSTWTLTVFVRAGHRPHWHTLGLGELDVDTAVRSPVTGPRDLERALQRKLAAATPRQLAACRPPLPAELVKVHLELNLPLSERRYLSGHFPLIVTTPRTSEPGRDIAFCPFRPADFFVVDPGAALERQANRFFGAAWSDLPDAGPLERWRWQKGDRLLTVAVKVALPELRPKRPEQETTPLIGMGRRREAVLDELGASHAETLAPAIERAAATRPAGRLSAIARGSTLDRLLRLLRGEAPRPVVLLGAAGGGKSTQWNEALSALMVEDLYLEHGRLDLCLEVHALSGRRLIAGMSHYGEWEQRCLDLFQDCGERRLARLRQAQKIGRGKNGAARLGRPTALLVDDLAAWGQIGRSRESERCLADVFTGPLRRGELLLLGEATPEAWALLEDEAPAFAALFARVELRPPTAGQMVGPLLARARRAEENEGIPVLLSTYRALLEISPALYGDQAFPGGASRLLELAIERGESEGMVTSDEVANAAFSESGIDADFLAAGQSSDADGIRRAFGRHLLGQPEAVEVATEVLLTLRAGMVDSQRPFAVLLFTGPTGTGKTELAKLLALHLYADASQLVRFDMGEHADADAVARLIGERGRPQGLLTEAIRAKPFSVLLFDEIEKAHPAVLHLLLQVFEDGRLTDALGQRADFRHCVIVLTSNLGSEKTARVGLGQDAEGLRLDSLQAVERFFAPELFNRIDRVIAFRPLDTATARTLADLELRKLFGRRGFAARGAVVETDARVVERVVELGFDSRSGARGLQRYLDRELVPTLTRALAEADPAAFLVLRLFAPAGGGFAVSTTAIPECEPLPADPELERLLALPPARLQGEIPGLLARLTALQGGEHGERLGRELSRRVAALALPAGPDQPAGERELHADAAHQLDLLRGRLAELSEQLQLELERRRPDQGELLEASLTRYQPRDAYGRRRAAIPPEGRARAGGSTARAWSRPAEALIDLATEIRLLELAIARDQPDVSAGQVTVELFLLGGHAPRAGGSAAPRGLIADLAWILAGDADSIEEVAAEAPASAAHGPEGLKAVLSGAPGHLAMVLGGQGIAERLMSDRGCYLHLHSDGHQEVVRVELHRGAVAPAALIARAEEARAAYLAEVAAGRPARDPDGPLPLVQRLHWDRPGPGSHQQRRCRVEDFALCVEVERSANRLSEVLRPLRRRRQLLTLESGA